MTVQALNMFGPQRNLALQPGPVWPSFEQFRKVGSSALAPIGNGVVGALTTRSGRYRIVEEHDFQRLVGLAAEVERQRNGFQLIIAASKAVQRHRDDATVETLIHSVSMIGELPSLPTRIGFEKIAPEGLELDPDDEVILNVDELGSAFAAQDPT